MSRSMAGKKLGIVKTLIFLVLVPIVPIGVLVLKPKAVEEKPLRIDLGVVADADVGERRAMQKLSEKLKTFVGINRFVVVFTVKGQHQLVTRYEIEYDRQAATVVERGTDTEAGVLIDDGGGPMRRHDLTEAKVHAIAARHRTLFIAEN